MRPCGSCIAASLSELAGRRVQEVRIEKGREGQGPLKKNPSKCLFMIDRGGSSYIYGSTIRVINN